MRLRCFHEPIDDADIVIVLVVLIAASVGLVSAGFLLGAWWAS